jgi:hypothetical protein
MKIYKLVNFAGYQGYDTYDAMVIAASSAKRARQLANEETGDEGKIWADANMVSCEMIGRACSSVVEGRIIGSFNAG